MYQKSSYGREKSPQNATLAINGTHIWSHAYQFNDTETATINSNDLKSALQTYVNSCQAGTLCQVPLSFFAAMDGNITLDNINITYTYSPSGVSTSATLNSTTVTAGQNSYIANLTNFSTSVVQDINISYYDVPDTATTC